MSDNRCRRYGQPLIEVCQKHKRKKMNYEVRRNNVFKVHFPRNVRPHKMLIYLRFEIDCSKSTKESELISLPQEEQWIWEEMETHHGKHVWPLYVSCERYFESSFQVTVLSMFKMWSSRTLITARDCRITGCRYSLQLLVVLKKIVFANNKDFN